MKRAFEVRNPSTGETTDIPVPDMPEDIIYPLKAYLGELPSYDLALDWNKQKTEEPSKQHGFAQFYFTRTFELLGVSLGHIFKVEQSDVDMRDVVLNRRILVVNLPALESSDERLAALGKIVVASLRGMMAQMLGARLEGDYRANRRQQAGDGLGALPCRPRRGRLLRDERHGPHARDGPGPQLHVLPPAQVRNVLREYLTVAAKCKLTTRADRLGVKVPDPRNRNQYPDSARLRFGLESAVEDIVDLSKYAWMFRYPGDPPEPTVDEAKAVLERASRVIGELRKRIAGSQR